MEVITDEIEDNLILYKNKVLEIIAFELNSLIEYKNEIIYTRDLINDNEFTNSEIQNILSKIYMLKTIVKRIENIKN